MTYLLDTHALIWWLEGDDRFPLITRDAILEKAVVLTVSTVSFWEISIKRSLGKLTLNLSTEQLWQEAVRQQIEILSILPAHLTSYEQLPFHHRDPFDRLLIAQAKAEDLIILTRDSYFSEYEVDTHWE